jgi:intracellular septation protein A
MSIITLLLQMLPLLVFIVADAIFSNVKISIIVAVVFAVVQTAVFYLKTGQFDWFILLDVGLIIGLGAVSIIFKNELFFKIKPAIVELAAIIFFLVMIFSPEAFLLGYFGRMMPKGMMRPEVIGAMKSMLGWMCLYILMHIGAVMYTALYSSRRIWAFVSGPGFYLLFIPLMATVLIRAFIKRRKLAKVRQAPPPPFIIERKDPPI